MVPTVSHSSSQSKISDTFRSSSKATKPIKETKVSVSKRPTKPLTPPPVTQPNDQKHLNPNDPKLLSVARAIESNRQAPFGIMKCSRKSLTNSTPRKSIYYTYHTSKF